MISTGDWQPAIQTTDDEQKGGDWNEVPPRVWNEVLNGLPELEVEVVKRRFGIGGGQPLSVTQIATALKLGRERIRKIERKALNRFAAIRSEHNP